MASNIKLSDLMSLRTWHAEHVADGGKLFRTFASLEWFIRHNREQLVTSGALLPQRGSRRTLVTPDFDEVVLRLLQIPNDYLEGSRSAVS